MRDSQRFIHNTTTAAAAADGGSLGLPGFADLGEALKSYFEKYKCFDKRSKHNLFGIKSILNKWKSSNKID